MHYGVLDHRPHHPSVFCPSTNNLHETISKYNKETQPSTVSFERTRELHHIGTVCYAPPVSCSFVVARNNGDQTYLEQSYTHNLYCSLTTFPILSSLSCSRRWVVCWRGLMSFGQRAGHLLGLRALGSLFRLRQSDSSRGNWSGCWSGSWRVLIIVRYHWLWVSWK